MHTRTPHATPEADNGYAAQSPPSRAQRERCLFDLHHALQHQGGRGRPDIEAMVPHRPPMLLLDAVLWCSDNFDRGLAVKRVRTDELWLQGHFPGDPVVPGVVLVEAGAQLACYLHNSRLGHMQKAAFIQIDRTTFRHMVRPGDTVHLLCAEVRWTPRRFLCDIQGVVGSRVVFGSRIAGVAV